MKFPNKYTFLFPKCFKQNEGIPKGIPTLPKYIVQKSISIQKLKLLTLFPM